MDIRLGGMSGREIARFLGISPNAIRQRLYRARAQLKEEMLGMMSTTFEGQRLQVGFTLRVVETVKRTIKNISNKCQDIKPSLGIQEWFHSEGESQIISYQITDKDGTILYPSKSVPLT
jgi:predicted DNA binding protein